MADLAGTTPADTYKGLLQVNDYTDGVNATAKYIQDGEGTDSALAISTGNVGIGTTNPNAKLEVDGTIQVATATPIIKLNDTNATDTTDLVATVSFQINGTEKGWMGYGSSVNDSLTLKNKSGFTELDGTSGILFSNDGAEKMRIDSAGNVGIGTASPAAPLEVSSTTGGVIMPRMTTTERNAIASPTNGEMVYDTDLNKFYGYANNAWTALH